MCGIAGIVNFDGSVALPSALAPMCSVIAHRGPDAHGSWAEGAVALGHRRLSILDLDTGDQPLTNEDGTIWIVFNGEIYNHAEIRDDMLRKGHSFRTRTDTETIVHAYEEYGPECVKLLHGMFAFALWDGRRNVLLLARDRVGKKPLFYSLGDRGLVFGSEMQSVLQHPSVDRSIDQGAIDEYLTYGYVPAPRSIFSGVKKLLPAHYLVVDPSRPTAARAARYWAPQYAPKFDISADEAEEGLLGKLQEAVRLRMVADVPIGALLSGGIDSSIVVALMAMQSEQKVRTFSIGFQEGQFNELPYARMVADRYGTDHHEFIVRPKALEVLPMLVRHYGEPFADSSSIPSYYVSQIARQHVKVAMNGDGGDECLGGYERYLASTLAEQYRRLPLLLRRCAIEPLTGVIPNRLNPKARLRQIKRFFRNAARPSGQRYTRWMTYFSPEEKLSLYSQDFKALIGDSAPEAWLAGLVERPVGDHLDQLLQADLESYLPNDLLVKMDIATMANSLEARSPFLDTDVLEFAARLPSSLKIHGTSLKWLSRRLARRLMPKEAVDRRKMGFGVPVGDWLRGDLKPLIEDVLLSRRSLERGLFDPASLRLLAARHAAGHDHSSQLWSLLWLEMWHREMLENGWAK